NRETLEKDPDGCTFDVSRDVLEDALDVVNSPKEPISLQTGNSLRIVSDSGRSAILPKIRAEPAMEIGLSMEAQEHLRKVLAPKLDAVRIKIVGTDRPYCIWKK